MEFRRLKSISMRRLRRVLRASRLDIRRMTRGNRSDGSTVSRFRRLSGPFHEYGGIRPPMHPVPRRCSSVKYSRYSPLLAPCGTGASAPSVRHRNCETDHLACHPSLPRERASSRAPRCGSSSRVRAGSRSGGARSGSTSELLVFLVWRDVKVRYKQTALGAAWALLQPLLTMAVFCDLSRAAGARAVRRAAVSAVRVRRPRAVDLFRHRAVRRGAIGSSAASSSSPRSTFRGC